MLYALTALRASGIEDPCLSIFPVLFTLIKEKQGMSLRLRLEIIATLPLTDQTLLLIFLEIPEPHIPVLWGIQYVIPSFSQATPEDGTVLAFSRDARLGILPATVEVNPDWLTMRDVSDPTITEIDVALAETGPGVPRLQDATEASDAVVVSNTAINPLALVHPLLGHPSWNQSMPRSSPPLGQRPWSWSA